MKISALTIHGSESRSRNLRHDNPAARAPSKLEESSEQEDARQGEVTDRWDVGSGLGRVKANIESDDEHCAALGNGSPKQRASATKRVCC